MKRGLIIILLVFFYSVSAQTELAKGEQPQMTVDTKGVVRVVFGEGAQIYFTTSHDNGLTFPKPELVGKVPGMHLGMTRGPQLATSKDRSVITAMDKAGNIHSFIQSHKTGKWQTLSRVNDVEGSAPEGLMSLAADDNNNFYAVWLDLRKERKNNICFAVLKNNRWSVNKFIYVSPEDHVCECCKPSVAVNGKNVAVMFRNWLKGSRDPYLVTSADGGISFSEAQRSGQGTWPLKGCPMDGGGLSIDADKHIYTAWQRDGVVYEVQPGQAEQRIGEGRHVQVNGNVVSWQSGPELRLKKTGGNTVAVGEGTALQARELSDRSILAIWEKDGVIVSRKL